MSSHCPPQSSHCPPMSSYSTPMSSHCPPLSLDICQPLVPTATWPCAHKVLTSPHSYTGRRSYHRKLIYSLMPLRSICYTYLPNITAPQSVESARCVGTLDSHESNDPHPVYNDIVQLVSHSITVSTRLFAIP